MSDYDAKAAVVQSGSPPLEDFEQELYDDIEAGPEKGSRTRTFDDGGLSPSLIYEHRSGREVRR
jgi:hypothetical protein